MVGGVVVDSVDPNDLVLGGLQRDLRVHRVDQRHRLDGFEIPGPSLEPVRLRRQGTNRADLNGVAREIGYERFVGEGVHLNMAPAVFELDEGVARDLVREAGTSGTQDAAFPVEVDEV